MTEVVMKNPDTESTKKSCASIDASSKTKSSEVLVKDQIFSEKKSSSTKERYIQLFIGGIAIQDSEKDVLDVLQPIAKVLFVKLIRKKGHNENKGFGFVGVPNIEEANKINQSDIVINGKRAETYVARSRMEAKNRIISERYKKLFVGGLNMETESKDLKDYFKKFGSLNRAYVITDSVTKTSRGFGFLEFNDLASTKKVLTIKSFKLDGNMIQVKPMMLRAELEQKPPVCQKDSENPEYVAKSQAKTTPGPPPHDSKP